jgi:hypothetical protein
MEKSFSEPPASSHRPPSTRWLIPSATSAFEGVCVFLAILVYIWWLRPVLPHFWIWILAFVLGSQMWRRETPSQLGFRVDGFAATCLDYGRIVLAVATTILFAGLLFGTIREIPLAGAIGNFVLYCFWGLFQQYMLNGYFARRIRPDLAAILFSLVHFPNWFLMVTTLVGGYAAVTVYSRYRNLYAVGLGHAIFGFALYLTVPDTISHHLYVGPRYFTNRF